MKWHIRSFAVKFYDRQQGNALAVSQGHSFVGKGVKHMKYNCQYLKRIFSLIVTVCVLLSATICAWQIITRAETKVIENTKIATDIFTLSVGMESNNDSTWNPNFDIVNSWGTSSTNNRAYAVSLPVEENTTFKLNSFFNIDNISFLENALGLEDGDFDYKFYASKNLGKWTEITDVIRVNGDKNGDLTAVSHSLTVPEDMCYIKIEYPNDRAYRNESSDGNVANNYMFISGYEYTECKSLVDIFNFENSIDRDKVQKSNLEYGNSGNNCTPTGFRATWGFCYQEASETNRAYITVPAVPAGNTVVINTVDKIDDTQTWGFEISSDNKKWQGIAYSSLKTIESTNTIKSNGTQTYTENSYMFTLPNGTGTYSIKILFPQVTKVNGGNMYFVLRNLSHYKDTDSSSDITFESSNVATEVYTFAANIAAKTIGGENRWIVADTVVRDADNTWGKNATNHRAFGISKIVEPGTKFTVKSVIKKDKITALEAALNIESGKFDYKFYASPDMGNWTEIIASKKETGGSGDSVNVTHELTVPDGMYFIKIEYPNDRDYRSLVNEPANDYIQMQGYSYTPCTANKMLLNFATEDGGNLVQKSNVEFGNMGHSDMPEGLRLTWAHGYQSVSENERGFVTVPAVTPGETFTVTTANTIGRENESWKFAYTSDNETWTEVAVADIKTTQSEHTIMSQGTKTYTINTYSFDIPDISNSYLVKIYYPQTTKENGNNMNYGLLNCMYNGKSVQGDITLELEYPEEEIVDDFTNYPDIMDFSKVTLQDAYNELPSYTLDGVFTLNDASYKEGNESKSLLTLTFASLYWNTINEKTGKAYISYLVEPGTAFKVRTLRHSYMDVLAQTLDSDFKLIFYGSKNGTEWSPIENLVTYKAVKNNLYTDAKHQAIETYEIAEIPEDIHFIRIYFPHERSYNDVLGGNECGQWNLALKYVAYTKGDINDVPVFDEEDDEDDEQDNSDDEDYIDDRYDADDEYNNDNENLGGNSNPVINNNNSSNDNQKNDTIIDDIDTKGEKILKNERSGISVSYKDGVAFSSSVKLSVETIATKNIPKKTLTILGDKRFVTYSIGMRKNNTDVQPNNDVIIEIPVSKDFYAEGCIVCRVADDGKLTDMSAALEDGKLVFKTNRLGNFVVIENLTKPVNVWMYITFGMAALFVLTAVYVVIVTVKLAKKR